MQARRAVLSISAMIPSTPDVRSFLSFFTTVITSSVLGGQHFVKIDYGQIEYGAGATKFFIVNEHRTADN